MTLEFKEVGKKYPTVTALDDVSFTLTEGIYGLLGPNGAGKSTLINILSGNLTASCGQVLYNGVSTVKMGEKFRAKLGYMPQQQALYPNFTVWRFMTYMAALQGLDRRTARNQIERILAEVELESKRNARISTLSGGMKQRLLIAQALLGDPDILILDEPTAGLDPRQRILIRNLIARVSLRKITLIATHVVSDVEHIAKEILLLRQGKLIRKSAPGELIEDLREHVFELTIGESQLPEVSRQFQVESIAQSGDGLRVRVLSKLPPEGWDAETSLPTLEDVYLWHFKE